jgi:hypothetical protein
VLVGEIFHRDFNNRRQLASCVGYALSSFRSGNVAGAWVKQMLQGHLNYYAVSGNDPSLWWFVAEVRWRWLKTLKRRSQHAFLRWNEFTSMTDRFFPPIRILHPQPLHRFDARTRGRSPVR